MSQREQQLEDELTATRSLIRAVTVRDVKEAIANLNYVRQQRSREAAVAAWRPYDE